MSGTIDGYLTRAPYARTLQPEVAPARLDYVANQAGYKAPRRRPGDRFSFCDLGCGHGTTTNLLAAALPQGSFLGLDAMAEHVGSARAFAKANGIGNVAFKRDTFAAAVKRDYGPFDYIACHGVYSWVSEQNRAALAAFIDRFLKPGGLVYLGYNCLPGWSGLAPIQHILAEVARCSPAKAPAAQFEQGAALVERMREAQAVSLFRNRSADFFLDEIRELDRAYLVHEYLHDTWQPVYGGALIKRLGAIGLDHLGSTRLLENREDFFLRKSQRAILDGLKDPTLRDLVRDHFIGQSFRMDVFGRGARKLTRGQAWQRRLRSTIAPALPPAWIKPTLKTSAGTLSFDNQAFTAIVAALRAGPTSLGEIAAAAATITEADILNTADALLASGQCHPVDPRSDMARVERVNLALRDAALDPEAIQTQVSPFGGLISTSRCTMLLLERDGSRRSLEQQVVAHLEAAKLTPQALFAEGPNRKRAKTALRETIKAFVDQGRAFYRGLGIAA